MNFRQLMALAPLNDEKFILGNKSYDEVVEIAALRKVELDRLQKEFNKLQKEYEYSLDKWQQMYYTKFVKNIELQKEYDKLQKKYDDIKKSSNFYENVSFSLVQELEEKIENLEKENEQLKISLMTAYIPRR